MEILVLNGSPHQNGNTVAMIRAFKEGAESQGHHVSIIEACRLDIAGCLGCEYCHTRGGGTCIQKDDMQQVYEALETAEMVVFASPVYYFGYSGQLQCLIHRTYAVGVPPRVRQAMMFLSSGSGNVYEAAVYQYEHTLEYWGVRDAGIFTAHGWQNKSEQTLAELREAGRRC